MDYTKTKHPINDTTQCVCVCLGLQMGLYRDRGPLYGPLQLSLVVPTLPAFSPSWECHNPSVFGDWPPTPTRPLPPEGPLLLGVLIQGWGRSRSNGTGASPTLESACATGQWLSDTCRCMCHLSILIPSTSELMTPGTRTWRNHLMLRTRPQTSNHPRLAVSMCNPSSSSLTVGTSASNGSPYPVPAPTH